MSQNEFRGKYEAEAKKPLQPYYPVIGLIVMAIAAAIAYFVSTPVFEWIVPNLLNGNTQGQELEIQIAIGVVVWLVIISVFGAMFAVFQPKTSKLVSESALKGEKDEREADRLRAQRRRKQMQQKMRKANKDFTEI